MRGRLLGPWRLPQRHVRVCRRLGRAGVREQAPPTSPVHLPYISRTSPLQEEVAAVRILQGLLRARGEAAYAPGAQPEEG